MANYKNSHTAKAKFIAQTIQAYKLWKQKAELAISDSHDESVCFEIADMYAEALLREDLHLISSTKCVLHNKRAA